MAGDLAGPEQRRGEHEADPALLEHVRGAVADPGLEPGVGGLAEAERVGEPVGGLDRVADVELDVVDAEQRHLVVAGLDGRRARRRSRAASRSSPRGSTADLSSIDSAELYDSRVGAAPTSPIPCVAPASGRLDGSKSTIEIIALLRENARRSFQDIGGRVALSAPAVKRRVDRLERDGVIRGYSANVDPSAIGWNTHAFVELFCEGRMSGDAGPRRGRRVPRGRGGLHDRRGPERDPPPPRRRHPAPRGGAGAGPRHPGRDPHPDPGRALDPVRAPRVRDRLATHRGRPSGAAATSALDHRGLEPPEPVGLERDQVAGLDPARLPAAQRRAPAGSRR